MRDRVDGGRSVAGRLLVCVIVMASVLVPSLSAPARVIKVPVTLARTVRENPEPAQIVREPFDFAPTHIGFSWTGDHGTGVVYRTISALGETSRWRRAREAHDAEGISEGGDGDFHFSAVLSVDRPEAIEWKPVVARGQTIGTVTLDYLNTLDGPDRLVEIPATAEARASAPDVVTRAQWGADESLKHTSGSCRRHFYPLQQLFVHHTAGSNFDRHPRATMRAIYWFHVVRQGWCDIGYNFVISPDGSIFEGRWARRYKPWELHDSESPAGNAVAGAHVARFNSGSVGVSLMGNYTSIRPSPAMYRTLVEFLAWEADRHDLRPRGTHRYRNPETRLTRRLPVLAGHRDAGQTACPGNRVYRSLSAIRRDTATVIGAGKIDSITTLTAGRPKITYGQRATVTGVLTNSRGTPLAGRSIRTYKRSVGGGWRVGPQGVTGADGAFTLTLRPKRTLRVVAIYDGDAATWGSESPAVRIRVAPIVTLELSGGVLDATGVYRYPAGTTEIPIAGSVTPAHPRKTVRVTLSKLGPDGTFARISSRSLMLRRDSSYRTKYQVPDPGVGGTYRATARFLSDGDHASASSEPATFFIDPSS
jgi:N-acetylmuramoyl-L-alanine amidase